MDVRARKIHHQSNLSNPKTKQIKWRESTFAPICISQRFVQIRSEDLKIHNPGKGFKLVAQPAQASQTLFNIKETELLRIK